MFNYTHEVIINSNAGSLEGGKRIGTYTDEALGVKHLIIERAGDYRADLIFPRGEGVVFKTGYKLGAKATLTIAAPTGSDAPAAGDVFQFDVFAKLLDPAALSEYAYPNWAEFGKPIHVGFTLKDASKFAEELAAALKDAIPFNNRFVTVSISSSKVVLTASIFGLEFEGASLSKFVAGECDPCNPDGFVPTNAVITATGTELPFGTGEMLVENYRFPTYGNRRYAALNSDETPVPGANYVMYSFAYDSPRPGLGGLSGVGQKIDAVTRHIYWVREDIVSDFEHALSDLGITPTAQE